MSFLSVFEAFMTTSAAVMVGTLSTEPHEQSHVFRKHLPHVLLYPASSSNRRRMRCTDATGGLKLHLRMKDATTELAGTLNPLLLFASISSYTMLCTKNKSISTRSGSSRCCNIIRTRGCPAYKICHCCKTAAVVSQGMAKVRLMCLHCHRLT